MPQEDPTRTPWRCEHPQLRTAALVQPKRITDRVLGRSSQQPETMGSEGEAPSHWAISCNFLDENCYFNAAGSHFARVQNHLKEINFQHLKNN